MDLSMRYDPKTTIGIFETPLANVLNGGKPRTGFVRVPDDGLGDEQYEICGFCGEPIDDHHEHNDYIELDTEAL